MIVVGLVVAVLLVTTLYIFYQTSRGEVLTELHRMVKNGEIVEKRGLGVRYFSEKDDDSNLSAAAGEKFTERGVRIQHPDIFGGRFTGFLVMSHPFRDETIAAYPIWHLVLKQGLFLPPSPDAITPHLFPFKKSAVVLIEGEAPGLPTEKAGASFKAPLVPKKEFLKLLRETLPEMKKNGRKAEVFFLG